MNDVLEGFRGEFVEIERCISCFYGQSFVVDENRHEVSSKIGNLLVYIYRETESLLNLFPKVRQSKAGLNGSKLSHCSVTKH